MEVITKVFFFLVFYNETIVNFYPKPQLWDISTNSYLVGLASEPSLARTWEKPNTTVSCITQRLTRDKAWIFPSTRDMHVPEGQRKTCQVYHTRSVACITKVRNMELLHLCRGGNVPQYGRYHQRYVRKGRPCAPWKTDVVRVLAFTTGQPQHRHACGRSAVKSDVCK